MRRARYRPLSSSDRKWCPSCFRYWHIEMADKPKIRYAKRSYVLGSRRISCPLCFVMLLPRQFEVAAVALDWNPESEPWRGPGDHVPPPGGHFVPDEPVSIPESDVNGPAESVVRVPCPRDNLAG